MKISVNNVHLDLGAGRRGTDMGPSAIYRAGLVDRLKELGHEVDSLESIGHIMMEATDVGDPSLRYLEKILPVCQELKENVVQQMGAGQFPLILGGDHSQSIGSVAGVASHLHAQSKSLGVLWFDAHADMNTHKTSPSGNIHGMSLAVLLGLGSDHLVGLSNPAPAVRPENVVIFGARDVDSGESDNIRATGTRIFTMSEIDYRGIGVCLDEAIDRVCCNTDGIHLSLDLDAVDPTHAPGVGTPVPGGFTLRESHLFCERVCGSGMLVSMEVVELNPTLDSENGTAKLAVWLIESALGRHIL